MLEQLINGLAQGSIYALLALGFTIIFGVLRMVTFAHGEVFMVGAYTGFMVFSGLADNLFLAIALAMIVTFMLGSMMEYIAFGLLRDASHFSSLLVTIGFSIVLQQLCQLTFGSHTLSVPMALIEDLSFGEIQVFGSYISYIQIAVLVSVIIIMALTYLFFKYSKMGTAIRATAQDYEAAMAMGINVKRIFNITFAVGSMMGGLAGILIGFYYNLFYPTMGVMLGLKAFSVAVIGGLASMPGAIIAGLGVGIIEVFSVDFVNSSFRHLLSFTFMFLILLIKPSGLFAGGQLKQTRGD